MRFVSKKSIKYLSFFVLVIVASAVPQIVRAGYDQVPSVIPEGGKSWIRLSAKTNDSGGSCSAGWTWTWNGGGFSCIIDNTGTGANAFAKTIDILVYRNSPSANTVIQLNPASNSDCNTIHYMTWMADDGGDHSAAVGPNIKDDNIHVGGNCSGDANKLTIPRDSFNNSYRFPGKMVAMLHLSIVGDHIATFSIRTPDASTANSRFSFVGTNASSTDTGGANLGTSNGILLRAKAGQDITTYFAPTCDYNGGSRVFAWKDADSGTTINPGIVHLTITDNGVPIYPYINAGNGSDVKWRGINIQAGHKYAATFSGVDTNNGIKVWLPFDSAGYDKDCSPPPPLPNSWQLWWSDSYLTRDGTREPDKTVGDFADPGSPDAPQPGQTFQYINDAQNIGDTPISNQKWYCPDRPNNTNQSANDSRGNCYKSTSGIHTHSAGGTHYDNDRDWVQTPNIQTVGFSNGANLGTGVGQYGLLGNNGNPGWVWQTSPIGPQNGGQSICLTASATPSSGSKINPSTDNDPGSVFIFKVSDGFYSYPLTSATRNAINGSNRTYDWNVNNATVSAPQLCVNVPFYYNLTPSLSMNGDNIQQGDPVTFSTAKVSNTQTGSRNYTNSEGGLNKRKGVVELVIPSGTPKPTGTNLDPKVNSTQDPCTYMQAKVASSTCNRQGEQTGSVAAGGNINFSGIGRSATDTANMPVGTKLCYAAYAQHPKNTDSGDVGGAGDGVWSYSTVVCHVIVKSPKVHFLNGDVTVGRYRSPDTTPCPIAIANAPIITAPSPSSKAPSNLYGSWVEYGAFATGNITNFGSAAVPFGIAPNQPHRLTFGNNNFATPPSNLGGFSYGKNCLANPFGQVKDDNSTNLASIGPVFDATTGDLHMSEMLNSSLDKTGYVSSGKSINLTPRSPDIYEARVTVVASGQAGRDHPGSAMVNPQLLLSVGKGDGGQLAQQTMNVDAVFPTSKTYTQTFSLGDSGWRGPQDVGTLPVVSVQFINNNDNDDWRNGGAAAMVDRNAYVGTIKVEWLKNGVPIPGGTYGPVAAETLSKNGNDYFLGATNPPCPTTKNMVGTTLFPLYTSIQPIAVDHGHETGYCWGVHVNQSALGFPAGTPPPNQLNDTFTGFTGRDIVLYAKKNDGDTCSGTSSGNITINQDIIYKRDGFGSVTELPRLVFMADCNITITDGVTRVYASLIAGDAIKTCDMPKPTTQDRCNQRLTVAGAISANRLLLWRTYGADLTNDAAAQFPAETFDLSPSQIVAGYSRGLKSAKPTTVYEVDLPPRY